MGILQFFVDLELLKPCRFQSFSGYAVRGLFYEAVRAVDEGLAASLHQSKGLAPFSTLPLVSLNGGRLNVVYRFSREGSARAAFTLLDDELANAFFKGVTSFTKVKLGSGEAVVKEIEVRDAEYERMYGDSKPIEAFKVKFVTPTYFRYTPRNAASIMGWETGSTKGYYSPYRFWPLPDPILMFKGLVRLWRRFSSFPIDLKAYTRWLEVGGVALAGFPKGLRTVEVVEHPTTKKWSVGFVGEALFSLPKDTYSERFARLTHLMLKFGELVNVGGGRTAGMGAIKFEPRERRQNGEPGG